MSPPAPPGAVRALLLTALTALAVGRAAGAADAPAYPRGASAFQANCAVCHGAEGRGISSLAPPLLSYPAHYAASAEGRRQLAMTVLFGLFGDITVGEQHYNFKMPDFARLDDATLAATLNYVAFDLAHADSTIKPLAPEDIAAERARPLDGTAVRAHRKSLAAGGS